MSFSQQSRTNAADAAIRGKSGENTRFSMAAFAASAAILLRQGILKLTCSEARTGLLKDIDFKMAVPQPAQK